MKPLGSGRGHKDIMAKFLRSIGTSATLGAALLVLSIEVIAPRLPPYAGLPDLRASRSLTLPASPTLRLDNSDGAIRVMTTAGASEVRVDVEIKMYALNDRADLPALERYLESLVLARSDAGDLTITTEPLKRPESMALQVAYTVHVPEGTNIDITGSNGNIWVGEGCGEVRVHSGNADIEILEPGGAVIAQSTNGRIRVVDATNSTTLQTVNGNILAEVRDGILEASSINGRIKTRVLDPSVSGCVLNSENGGIEVILGNDVSFTVDATAQRGSIRSDFAVDGAGGRRTARTLRGSVGDGETKLNLTTGNGNIWLARG